MQPFIVIRNYREDDELKCQELVRDYIMSFSSKSFFVFCFREVSRGLRALSAANVGESNEGLALSEDSDRIVYIFVTDYTAIHSNNMGHILHISRSATTLLCPHNTWLRLLSLY